MTIWRKLASWLSWLPWHRRASRDADLARELRNHLDLEAADQRDAGLSPNEAVNLAHRALGNTMKIEEDVRAAWGFQWLETFAQDLRYGLRMFRKSPGFTAVAVLTLALGIGANTAIFSAVYGILLKPLPYLDSSRIVQIWVGNSPQWRMVYIRSQDFHQIASQSHAFGQFGVYLEGGSTITGPEGPEGVQTSYVSGDYFSALGAKPLLGRPILPADAAPGHDQVAVLSYDLWQRRYGGDPDIVGKTITIADRTDSDVSSGNPSGSEAYTVIGVMPSRFPFPNHGDLLLPEALWNRQLQLIAIGRLKKEISLAAANAELHTIATRIAAESPARHKNFDLSVGLLRDRMSEGYSSEFLILLGAVAFVLILACVNVSSLLIARSWTRTKEIAIRETLGATRFRLVRQMLSESVLLAILGAALGLLLAHWGINLLRDIAPPHTPRLDEVGLDRFVLAYTLGVAFIAGIVFGLVPAMRLTSRGPNQALKESGQVRVLQLNSRGPQRLRNLLVIGEISLAFILVVASALALRSFSNLMNVNLGFRPAHVLTMYVNFSPAFRANPERIRLAMDEVLERTRSLPGVLNTAFCEWLPIGGGSMEGSVKVEGKSDSAPVEQQLVTPEYFATLGIPLLAGRSFNERDMAIFAGPHKPDTKSPLMSISPSPRPGSAAIANATNGTQQITSLVAIVNEVFAKRYFDGKPLGRKFQVSGFGDKPVQVQIVGEVADTRDWALDIGDTPEYYIPFAETPVIGETTLLVRTAANPLAIAKAVRQQVGAIDNETPVDGLATMNALISQQVAAPRFRAVLLNSFGALGLLLAAVGVYGLISYAAVQRTHEIGIRVALGASRGDVLRMVLGEGLVLAFIGIGIGVAGALGLTRFLRSLLFEIKPTDPVTFVGVAILLALVALAACYIPARRAMRVDPMIALRYE